MQYYFKAGYNLNRKGHFISTMDRRIELMGHMEVDLLVDTCIMVSIGQIYLT